MPDEVSKRFVIDGYEYRPVILVSPSGQPYTAGGATSGGGGDASAENQLVGNGTLLSIEAKLPVLADGSVPVIGSVSVSNLPGTQPVSGPITDAQLRAAAVPVSLASVPSHAVTGPLTDVQLRAAAVPVSGSFFQATQPVSGPLTDAQLRATPVPKTSVPPGAVMFQAVGAAGGIVNTTAVVIAVALASNRHYLRSLQLSNGSTSVSSEVVLLDDVTVIWRGRVGTAAQPSGSRDIYFDPPLRVPSIGTALNIRCLTTAMALFWSAQGWTAA